MASSVDIVRLLFSNPIFLVGLIIKLLFLALVLPAATEQWYAPFLFNSVKEFGFDPWGTHLALGGDELAFPYGYAMWLIFLPLAALTFVFELPQTTGYGLTLLYVDVALLITMRRLTDTTDGQLLACYWMSPIVFFATYWLGFNDLLPILLLMLCLVSLREAEPRWAALYVGLAVSAKLSMVLAVPFLFLYLFRNKRLQVYWHSFVVTLAIVMLVLQVPYLLWATGGEMLFGNPELSKVYDVSLPIGNDLRVFLLPLGYLLALFGAWRVQRMSFSLLVALLGMAFFLVLLLTPAAPGWFVWVLPFLVSYQTKSDKTAVLLVGTFSLLYIGLNGLLSPLPSLPTADWPSGIKTAEWLGISTHTLSLWQTVLLATGLILASRMLREGIQENEYFRLSRRPFVFGIAGDSGSGKSTLADAVSGLFGQHSVLQVSGDDYHLWDRQQPMWQAMTHLDPRANELYRFADEIRAVSSGFSIRSRRYDHATGKMSAPRLLKSNDYIIVTGLHALYLPYLRELYDLKIYLDMDDALRRHYKIQRDMEHRGYSRENAVAELKKRESDAQAYIRPQIKHADLVLSIRPLHEEILGHIGMPLRLELRVEAHNGMNHENLVRVLIAVCGLHVDSAEGADHSVALTIAGEVDSENIGFAARELVPQLSELLDVDPVWHGGTLGLTQLVILTHMAQVLRGRLR